jgi:hypothetical protein
VSQASPREDASQRRVFQSVLANGVGMVLASG